MADVLLIENCDFKSYPTGGQLFFARQMMKAFGNRLALVGITTDETPVGQWLEKDFDGEKFLFFSIGYRRPIANKPLIPERINGLLRLWQHQKKILSSNVKAAFTQAPELLFVMSRWNLDSLCYMFPGVENPLLMPRYAWGRSLAKLFDKVLYASLKKTDVILACADKNSIDTVVRRSKGHLSKESVFQFPTRVDTSLFSPIDKFSARKELKLPPDRIVVGATGRINQVKGWDFIVESFWHFKSKHPDALLVFVGDGEDRANLEELVREKSLEGSVLITGFVSSHQVAKYLNAMDLSLIGSHKEGWSLAMLEALACGNPVVSTDVSGAQEMIVEGKNGFIVTIRDPQQFASAMSRALDLPTAAKTSRAIAEKYGLNHLAPDLGAIWKYLS